MLYNIAGMNNRTNIYKFNQTGEYGYDTQEVEEFTDYIIKLILEENRQELANVVCHRLLQKLANRSLITALLRGLWV